MVGKKHVTSACMNCRRRKIKCDGNEVCANCTVANLPCEYNAEADMRKISAKKIISELRERIAQLEDTLRQNGLDELASSTHQPTSTGLEAQGSARTSPIPRPATNGPVRGYSSSPLRPVSTPPPSIAGKSQPGPTPPPPAHSLFELVAAEDRGENADDEPHILANSRSSLSPDRRSAPVIGHHFVSLSTRDFFKGSTMAPPLNGKRSSTGQQPDEANAGSIENMLAARMGSLRIAEDGQMRYYGPTSNLHVQTGGSHFLSQSKIRQVATEGAGVLRSLGLDRVVPVEMEMHLARLYFTWEDPNVHAVDEEIYFEEKRAWVEENRASNYYSETLNNAICAIGASLAVDEDLGFPDGTASEFFSARAKAMLDIEMDSPTIATVQALVVMSASEAALTRDARGWLYSGMAARISADLGLHMDVTRHRDSGILTERDVRIRDTTFWGVFVLELMWSLYIGRPSGLGVRMICIDRPDSSLDAVKARMWKPYPRACGQASIPEEGLFFPGEALTDATISQCEFMARINATLYSGRTIEINDLMAFLIHTKKGLHDWHDNLPESLQVDLAHPTRLYIPSVLQLHMQFYALLITLYRPYLSTALDRRDDIVSQEARIALRNVSTDCVAAARQVMEYLRCFQRQHSTKRSNIQVVHIVFTASLIFIYDICSRPDDDDQSWASQRDLQFCSDLLAQLGRCFGNANRALEVTVLVKHQWWNLSTARQARSSAAKRDSGTMTRGDGWEDAGDRSKRRYSPTTTDAAQPFVMPPPSSQYQGLDPYLQGTGTFASGFGVGHQPPLESSDDLFIGDAEQYLNDVAGQMEWFDPAQFYSLDGSTSRHDNM